MAAYKTCSTESDFTKAFALAEQNNGRSVYADARHDTYMESLAKRMAAATAKLGETIDIRIS